MLGCGQHMTVLNFFQLYTAYTVTKPPASPRTWTWFTRLLLLVRGWSLGTRLEHTARYMRCGCLIYSHFVNSHLSIPTCQFPLCQFPPVNSHLSIPTCQFPLCQFCRSVKASVNFLGHLYKWNFQGRPTVVLSALDSVT